MTSENYSEDLHQGRGWLNRAAEMLDSCEDHVSDAEFAHAAAIIGNGFIALAHAERAAVSAAETSQVRQAILSLSDEPALDAAAEREKRAAAEARSHDNEVDDEVDQPDGIASDSHDLPEAKRASERVNAFLAWWGDGRILDVMAAGPPLFARDLQALANAAAAADRG